MCVQECGFVHMSNVARRKSIRSPEVEVKALVSWVLELALENGCVLSAAELTQPLYSMSVQSVTCVW